MITNRNKWKRRRGAFSVIEVLVAFAIVVIFAVLINYALNVAWDSSKRIEKEKTNPSSVYQIFTVDNGEYRAIILTRHGRYQHSLIERLSAERE